MRLPLFLIVILVAVLGLVGYSQYTKIQQEKADIAYLERYFAANTKHGTFVLIRNYPTSGGQQPNEDAQFWIKDKQVRIDMVGEGSKREVVTHEAVPYLCGQPPLLGRNICQAAVIPIETYILGFIKPASNVQGAGWDSSSRCNKYHYSIKNTFKMPDAPNSYYVEDLTYCIATGQLLTYTNWRGYIPEKDGTISDPNLMENVTYKFKNIETGLDISDSTFALPYPIENSPL